MGTVLWIRPMRGCVEVEWDTRQKLRLAEASFREQPVQEGDEVDYESYQDRIASRQAAACYEAALCYLERSERSAKELERSLLQKGYVQPAVDAVIGRLVQNGLVNDTQYAVRIAQSSRSRPVGVYALRRKLAAKGFAREDVDTAVEELDEEQQKQAALEAGKKLLRRYEGESSQKARQKLVSALTRRGFSWEAAGYAGSKLFSESDWEDSGFL